MMGLGQNQNLINPIRINKIEPVGKPEGFYKSIVLDAIGVVSAFLAGYAYFNFLSGTWPLLASIAAFLFFIIVLTLEALLGARAWRRIGILALEIIALLLPFYLLNAWILVASAAAAFIFLLAGYLQTHSELSHSTTVRFFRSTHGVTAKAVTATLLVAIILYFPMMGSETVFINESGFKSFFGWAAGLVNNFYPTIALTGSFDNFAQSVAQGELAGNTTFKAMPPADQSAAVAAAASQIEASLSRSFGFTPSAASSTSEVAYNAIEKMLQGWRAQFSVWFTVGWEISLFLIFRCIGIVAVWIGQFLAMIAYELLLASGVIRIVEEPQTKEVIEF